MTGFHFQGTKIKKTITEQRVFYVEIKTVIYVEIKTIFECFRDFLEISGIKLNTGKYMFSVMEE